MKNRLLVLKTTWTTPHYVALLVGATLIINVVIAMRNWGALSDFYGVTNSLGETMNFFLVLHGGLFTLFSPIGIGAIFGMAVLLSINLILVWQFVTQQRRLRSSLFHKRAAMQNIGSIVAIIFGIGCASCGYALLFSVLSIFSATGLIALLPLHGEELSIIGVIGLLYSNWYILGTLHQPGTCQI